MPCAFEKELLSAYHDGELDAAGRERVARHVAMCGECAREMEDVRSVSSMLRSAKRVAAPAEIADRVARVAVPRSARKVFQIRRYREAGLAAAAGLLIVFAAVALFRSSDPHTPAPAARPVAKGRAPADLKAGAPVAVQEPGREDLAHGAHPSERQAMGKEVPTPVPGEDMPAPRAAEPGFPPPGEPGIEPAIEEPVPEPPPPPPMREANVLVIGDDVRSADEAVNELLRKLSTDYRRRDSVWEATLTEAAAAQLVNALQIRADVKVSAAPEAGETLAKLADEAWHNRNAALGAAKADRARVQENKRSPEDNDRALAKGDAQDQRKDGAALKTLPVPFSDAPPVPAPSRGGRGGGQAEPAQGGFVQPEKQLDKALGEAQKPQTGAGASPRAEAELERAPEARRAKLREAKDAEKELSEEGAAAAPPPLVTLRIYIMGPDQSEKLLRQPAGRDK